MKLYLKGRNNTYCATCEYKDNTFIVKKGSKIKINVENPIISSSVERSRLDKTIVDESGNLKKDITFKSASLAAQFVVGQSINGRKAWKGEDGKSILNKKES